MGYVYALRFGAVLKVGHSCNWYRARGTSGYARERADYGLPESLLLASSLSRLEDEEELLRYCHFFFGKPIMGREWFACHMGSEEVALLFDLVGNRLGRDRAFAQSRVRLQNLGTHRYNGRYGIVLETRDGRSTVMLRRGGRCVRVPATAVKRV